MNNVHEVPETREAAKNKLEEAIDKFEDAIYEFNQSDNLDPIEVHADSGTLKSLEKIKAKADRLSVEEINRLTAKIQVLTPQGDGARRATINATLEKIAKGAKRESAFQRGTKEYLKPLTDKPGKGHSELWKKNLEK